VAEKLASVSVRKFLGWIIRKPRPAPKCIYFAFFGFWLFLCLLAIGKSFHHGHQPYAKCGREWNLANLTEPLLRFKKEARKSVSLLVWGKNQTH